MLTLAFFPVNTASLGVSQRLFTCLVAVFAAEHLRSDVEGAADDGVEDLARTEVGAEPKVGSLKYGAVIVRRQ